MKPILRNSIEGRTIAVVGDVYRFLLTGDDTDGKYALWEAIVPPGGGPPPRVHSREEECFYVIAGKITFQIGDEEFVATQGVFANMPDYTVAKRLGLSTAAVCRKRRQLGIGAIRQSTRWCAMELTVLGRNPDE
jgi:hypothetical protein